MGRVEVLGVRVYPSSIHVTITNLSNKACQVSTAIVDSERGTMIAETPSPYPIAPHETRNIKCPYNPSRSPELGKSCIVRLAVAPEGEEGFTVEREFKWSY